jgi:hypothetical protein
VVYDVTRMRLLEIAYMDRVNSNSCGSSACVWPGSFLEGPAFVSCQPGPYSWPNNSASENRMRFLPVLTITKLSDNIQRHYFLLMLLKISSEAQGHRMSQSDLGEIIHPLVTFLTKILAILF